MISVGLGVLLILTLGLVTVAILRLGDARPTETEDSFDTAAPTLAGATTANGLTWASYGGSFEIADGSARITSAIGPQRPVIGTVDVGHPTARVSAQLQRAQAGAGLVFAFEGSANYWELVAAPTFGTWNLNKVANGESTFVTNTGPSYTDEPVTIAVIVDKPSIVLVVGLASKTIADPGIGSGTSAGIIGRGSDRTTEWSAFSVTGGG